jgi:hypothetical protein
MAAEDIQEVLSGIMTLQEELSSILADRKELLDSETCEVARHPDSS